MDSYPSEFLLHLAPLLHVGGLDEDAYTDPAFASLVSSLRTAFLAKAGFRAYDSSRGQTADFHVVLVDKNARFPPRKGTSSSAGHSPLSPLSPASPLFPDGLMAPVWIRKHREIVPAAFILVARLWEPPLEESDPLSPGSSSKQNEMERQQDAALVTEILERKKQTAERGIKLAVVLLASRKMLEDANLDYRLSLIRRQSSLDARASLFVISPVAATEVGNFVASLRTELYEGAVDYYREHGRRARRKRSRVPTHVSRPIGQSTGPAPLGPQAWSVRYDYKMATFAELRQEIEVATKHYEDCYEGLLDLFNSATALPPRTKRWLEAKVLADCINAKICKLYMYTDEPDRCLAQLGKHVARFRVLCSGWSIGEDTFEYWSWLTKQYRLFGELLDTAIEGGFRLPVHRPPPEPVKLPTSLAGGVIPPLALLHPGYSFFLAAQCAEQRKLRFKTLEEAETQMNGSAEPKPLPKAIVHERQVKHDEQIIELYTKAYDFFKRFSATRTSLYVASAIAGVHFEAENLDVASRFFGRIAKAYRREHWYLLLETILHRSYVAARQQQDVPAAAKLALELLALGPILPDYAVDFELGLQPIFAVSTAPDDAVPITLEETSSKTLIEAHVSFWNAFAVLGDQVAFQLVLTAATEMVAKSIRFSSFVVEFEADVAAYTVSHANDTETKDIVALSEASRAQADLTWTPGSKKIFSGHLSRSQPGVVQLRRAVLRLEENGWQIELPLYSPNEIEEPRILPWYLYQGGHVVSIPERGSSSVTFTPRSLKVSANASCLGPAYLGEHFCFDVHISSDDTLPASLSMDLLLQPPDNETDVNALIIDGEPLIGHSTTINFDRLQPGQKTVQTQHIRCDGAPGRRLVDVSIHAEPVAGTSEEAVLPLAFGYQQSLAIEAIHPFRCDFRARYQHERSRPPKRREISDLTEPDLWDDAVEFLLDVRLVANGPSPLEIVALALRCEDVAHRLRYIESTFDAEKPPLQLQQDDTFGLAYRLEVAAGPPGPATGFLEVKWRRSGASDSTPISVTYIPLPLLAPPVAVPRVLVSLPSYAIQHEPTLLIYTVVNPSLTRPLRASIQVEGGEPWAFSGLRRTAPLLILPESRYEIRLTVVATGGAGDVLLPVVRVLEHLPQPIDEQSPSLGEEDATPVVRTRILPMAIEGSPPDRPLMIFVVPRGT